MVHPYLHQEMEVISLHAVFKVPTKAFGEREICSATTLTRDR